KDEVFSIGSPISAAFLRAGIALNWKQSLGVCSATYRDLPDGRGAQRSKVVRGGEAQTGSVRGPSNLGGDTILYGRQFLARCSFDVGLIKLMILGEDDGAAVG